MRRQGNVDTLGTGRLGISGDGARAARGLRVGSDEAALARKPAKCRRLAERSAPLWLTATFFAAMWACDVQAGDLSRSGDGSVRLAQASTHDSAELQAAPDQGQQKAEMLVRELANAWRDLEVLLNLLNKTRDEQVRAKQAADKEAAELRRALQEERDRAYEAQTRQAGDQATELKTAESSAADLRKSLQQERDRANQLEQDLAAAKREVETALATKASDEAAKFKRAAEKGSAELRQSLQQEQDKAERLANELATARARIYAFEAQARQASDQATELNTAESSAADLRKSLQQERDRANQLEQDLTAAKREVETALATKASDEAAKFKQVAEKGSAELRQSLQQEQDKAERLANELATARARISAFEAQARQASDQAAELKQAAEGGVADLRTSLQQERDRASRLEQDLAAAKRDAEKQTALAAKASNEAARLKQAAESGAADQRKSLQRERDRASRLEQALAAAKRDVDTQTALATKAGEEATKLKRAAESGAANQRKSLQQERDRASRLERDLVAAKRDVEAQTALATKAGDEAGKLKQAAESSAAEQRNSLVQEWERAARLQRDLAAARRDVETQTVLAASAHEETSRLKQIAEQDSADLRKALQLERDKAERLEGALALARTTKDASAVTVGQVVQDKQTKASGTTPVATAQVAVGDARAPPSSPEDVADAARLVARANVLLAHGDIGSARVVLQRAADAGDAQASFLLAETYDPLILPKWGTFGTRGDVAKALDLYAKAQAGGIEEAKERSDALRR
jgi:hypothetical protein